MAKIIAFCTGEEKGTWKKAGNEGLLERDGGLVGDAHAECRTHRQAGECVMPTEGIFAG